MALKATGIVRRIDELGRVVIPKEIRRTLRIHEGSPLEIFTDHEGGIILKKYSPVGELAAFAAEFVSTLHQMFGHSALICDKDMVVACAGSCKKELADQPISTDVEQAILARMPVLQDTGNGTIRRIAEKSEQSPTALLLVPIIAQSDAVGAVILFSVEPQAVIGEPESKTCQTIAAFLARQMEA